MRVLLPSHGYYGQKAVNLNQPTLGDMVYLSSYNKNDFLKKIEVVRRVSDVNLNKVTWNDLCYLYDLCVFTAFEGELAYKVKCSKCGEIVDVNTHISNLEIMELDKKRVPEFIKVDGKKYELHILRASDMLDAVDQSLYEDDEKTSLLKSRVAVTFGKKYDDFEFVDKLSVSEVATALAFDKTFYHGFVRIGSANCGCGNEIDFKFDTPSDVLSIEINTILDAYVGVSEYISMEDMMRLSLREFNCFIENVNKKLEQYNQ